MRTLREESTDQDGTPGTTSTPFRCRPADAEADTAQGQEQRIGGLHRTVRWESLTEPAPNPPPADQHQ